MVNPTGYTALDLIGFTDKDAYSSSDNYVKNDLVHYSGNIWRCLVDDTTGIAPAEGVNWTLFIGEPTNLVERIIAPVETDPATNAWAVGRQIIYNDNLYEVIAAITAGDSLVAYEDDPTNANIKLADPVETQLLNEESTRAAADLVLQNNLSHRNLLDNAWFTVNQRGQSSYSYSNYSADRWYLVRANATYDDDGLAITWTGIGSMGYVQNRLGTEATALIAGKTVTLSAIIDDELLTVTGTAPSASGSPSFAVYNSDNSYGIICEWPSNSTFGIGIGVRTYDSSNAHTIRAVKLEIGSVSTLAMDTAPNYAEELLKCQRYFYRLNLQQYTSIAFGIANTDTSCVAVFTLPTTMRIKPAVTCSDVTKFILRHGYSQLINTVTQLVAYGNNARILSLVFTATGLTLGDIYEVYYSSDTNDYIDFSADL